MQVLLADDQIEVRSALRLLLDQETGITIVGEAINAEELFAKVESFLPDLVLLDWELPGFCSKTASHSCEAQFRLLDLRECFPELKIVALSGRIEARWEVSPVQVDIFVSKSDPPEVLLESIHKLFDGIGGGESGDMVV